MRFWRREKLWIGFRFRNEQLSCLKLLNSIILLCLCSISWNVDFALSHIWYFVPTLFFLCAHFLKNTVPDCHFEKCTFSVLYFWQNILAVSQPLNWMDTTLLFLPCLDHWTHWVISLTTNECGQKQFKSQPDLSSWWSFKPIGYNCSVEIDFLKNIFHDIIVVWC